MRIHRGEIYYINKFPTNGSEQEPGRPAVIVSNDKNNETAETVEVVYLTTRPKKELPTHVSVCGTGIPSTALCEQISTVSVDRVGSYRGKCVKSEMEAIDTAMMVSLGLGEMMTATLEEIGESRAEVERDIYKEMYEKLLMEVMNT